MNRNVLVIFLLIVLTGCASSPNAIIPQTVKVERKAGWVDFSTFDGLLIRPVRDTLAVQLSAVEQDRISYVADSVRFWDLPVRIEPLPGCGDAGNNGENYLRVRTSTKDHAISWIGTRDGWAGDRAMRLRNVVDSIIQTRPPVQASHRSKVILLD